jgi:hypothetical protein
VPATWKALYDSHAVGVYALLVLPVVFLGRLAMRGFAVTPGVEPYAARFVRAWAIVFAVASMVDPIGTGLLGWPLVPFILLGDYRVFALVLVVMQPGRSRPSALAEAAGWTMIVPAIAYGTVRAVAAFHGEPPETLIWIVYEATFALLAIALAARLVPARVGIERAPVRRYVVGVLGFVCAYYLLWVTSDLLVLAGYEWAWGLRIVPNVLYYGAFVPFAYATFFASSSAASSTSTQAAR